MFDTARRIIKFMAGALLALAVAVVTGAYFFLPWPGLRSLSGPPPLLAFDASVGSGFFVDAGGYVLTNRHVVRHCRRITLAGLDFRAAPATLVATASDPLVDLALLHADSQLAPAALVLSPEPWPTAPAGNDLISPEEITDAMKAAGLAETGSAKVVGYPAANRGQAPDILPSRCFPRRQPPIDDTGFDGLMERSCRGTAAAQSSTSKGR